ncbi:MAG TPA: hypothetical protein PK954_19360 [Anaerolineales bacterium]|nr:hypothetical protein [Anaerolineales bacterium]
MTDRELALARLLSMALVAEALRRAAEQTPPAIHPTMRPDPQAAIATHGTLMSHANA